MEGRAGSETHILIVFLMVVFFLKKGPLNSDSVSVTLEGLSAFPPCTQMTVLGVDSVSLHCRVRCLELRMLLRVSQGGIRLHPKPIRASVATALYAHFIASMEDRGTDRETEAQGTAISNWLSLDSEMGRIPVFFHVQRHCTDIL